MPIVPHWLGDDWTRRQLSWHKELDWTRSSRHSCVCCSLLFIPSFLQPLFFSFKLYFMPGILLQMTAVITQVLLCHRLHSAVVFMEDVVTWRRRPAVILRSGHKSEAECFVAAGQSSCGKRQMWDLRSIWAKPHWCQQADRRWRHISDQHPPENSWPEPEGGADSRLAAASR